MKGCVAGCSFYSYHEAHHHKDCEYYPETFSKMYDDLKLKHESLGKELSNITFGPHYKPQKTIFEVIKCLNKYGLLSQPDAVKSINL